MADFDLAIIGGGINGTGIARDAAGRGFRVVLIEQNDLASGTSSASSKLIHGGLRYLEHREFRLVREALREREVLLRAAPHLIRPLRFVLPINEARRSALLLRLGLLLYDWIGRRKILPGTPRTRSGDRRAGQPLQARFHQAYEYSDCFADDARLVVLNAVDAAERGAVIRTTRCVRAERTDVWRLVLNAAAQRDVVTARILVNATGAWVKFSPKRRCGRCRRGDCGSTRAATSCARGSTITTALTSCRPPTAASFSQFRFERDFTLIGTTDQAFTGDPRRRCRRGRKSTICARRPTNISAPRIVAADVVWAFAGVRSLYDDGAGKPQDIGRDYALILDERFGEAPLLTVYGGKITTYRRLAEDALARLAHFFPRVAAVDRAERLPGGDFVYDGWKRWSSDARTWPFLSADHARRLLRAYGTRVDRCARREGPTISVCVRRRSHRRRGALPDGKEWAQTADDVLWRRSKLGLRLEAK